MPTIKASYEAVFIFSLSQGEENVTALKEKFSSLIEQNAEKALGISDYAYIMQTGVVVAEGTGKDLLADGTMAAAYLGS